MSCAIQDTVALSQVRNSLWKCFIESEIVTSGVEGVAEESVISDRKRPLSSRELLILPFLVVRYFLSFPSPVKRTFVYPSGCQAPAWQLCAVCLSTRKEDLQEGCPWESRVQPQFPSAAPRCSLQCNPSPILLSFSVSGSGSWKPWLIHHFAPSFPSGHRPENNIFFFFFCLFILSERVQMYWLFLLLLSLSQNLLHEPSLKLLQGCLECSGLSCLDSSNGSSTSREAPRQPKPVEHHHLPVQVVGASSLGCHHAWP